LLWLCVYVVYIYIVVVNSMIVMTETVDIETYLLIKTNFVIRKEDYRLFLQLNLEMCMLQ